jgi:hypothetical protein
MEPSPHWQGPEAAATTQRVGDIQSRGKHSKKFQEGNKLRQEQKVFILLLA